MGAVRNLTGGGSGIPGFDSIRTGFESVTGQRAGERAAAQGAAAMERATTMGVEEQRAAREQIAQQLAPYMGAGEVSQQRLMTLLGIVDPNANRAEQARLMKSPEFGALNRDITQGLPSVMPGNIEQDTLFQSLKRQAISGIEGSAAARGKLMSGTTPQAIAEQVQNLGLQRANQIQAMNLAARGQLFGERAAEQQRQYQQLFGLVGTGQASAAQQAANLQTAAANIGELYSQQANAQAAGLMAAANLKAQAFQGLMGAAGRIGGAAAGNPALMSDRRVKEDIKQVGTLDNGLPVYTFRYKGDQTVQMGVMAQDVEQVNPDAVVEIDGIKHVYYGAL